MTLRARPLFFFFIAVLCSLAFLHPAQAARFSGAYLLHVCASDKNGKELVPGGHIACQAYIAGIVDYHNLVRSLGTSPSVDFCVPEDVSLYELQRRLVGYLIANRSEHEQFVASPAVALALFSDFPCKN